MDDRFATSQDNWILALIGESFQCKELELEDDLGFKTRRPSNKLIARSVAARDGVKRRFTPASFRLAWKSLCFTRHSVDVLHDYKLAPSLSLHPKSLEKGSCDDKGAGDKRDALTRSFNQTFL